jgi:nucleoside phosphorylase
VLFRDPAGATLVATYRYGDSVVLTGLVRPDPQPDVSERSPDVLPEAEVWRSWLATRTPAGRPYQCAFMHIVERAARGASAPGSLCAEVSEPAGPAPAALAEWLTFCLLSDGEYLVDGPEDSRFLHTWIFDLARPFRLALFHGKALRYERELDAIAALRQPITKADMLSCDQKAKNVAIAAHNFRREWDAAGLGPMAASALGQYFDQALCGLVENAASALRRIIDVLGATVTPTALHYVIQKQPWHGPLPKVNVVPTERLKPRRNEIDVLVVTATMVEKNAVLRRMRPLAPWKRIAKSTVGPATYYVGRFAEHRVALTMCREGSVGSGSSKDAVREGIRFWRPRAVIMVGIAFGRDSEKQRIADVIVASQVISYAEQRVGDHIHYRGPIAEVSSLLLDRFRNADGWSFLRPDGTVCEMREGPMLSGEELIDHADRKKELLDAFPQAVGGEMEGRGLYAAANDAGKGWILVKAICDWADGTKHKLDQPLAAAAAVDLVYHVLLDPEALAPLPKRRKRR